MAVISIPQEISVSPLSTVNGKVDLSITVSVDQAGGSVQLSTDQPTLLQSPSGTWPHTVAFAAGGPASQTIIVTVSQIVQGVQANVFAARSGVDISNPSNRAAVASITLSNSLTANIVSELKPG